MLRSKGLPVAKATEILNCDISYVYKLIKRGKLEVAEAKPKTTISSSSILNFLTNDYPILKNVYSSLHYQVEKTLQPNWN
jgi:hypothetical protein